MNTDEINQRIAALTPEQRVRLEQMLLEQHVAASATRGIPRASRTEPLPLSFAQERLWFLDQLYPGIIAYNEPSAYRFTGNLDVAALQRSLNHIVSRHDVLRTVYVVENELPRQLVREVAAVPMPWVDLESFPDSQRSQELARLMAAEIARPFDLRADLMLRASLFRLQAGEHVLLLVVHHIASDGWSSGILERELLDGYRAAVEGRDIPHPDLSLSYADYAVWQRNWLQGQRLDKELGYWRRQLAGMVDLELATDAPRPQAATFAGSAERCVIPGSLLEELRALGRAEQATTYMVLLTAYAVLLHRYTGQMDLAVGTPTAGRIRSELEPLIGFFVNTLVMRVDLSGNPTFRGLLRRVRKIALDAYDHQLLPFEMLVAELQPERRLNHTPLIQTTFQVNDRDRPPAAWLPGVHMERVHADSHIAKFDLQFSLGRSEDGLSGWLRYNSDIFEQATIVRLLGHFRRLLEGIAQDPDRRIGAFPLLTEGETEQAASLPQGPQPASEPDHPVHTLFEAQVQRTPDATAVVFEGQHLTYSELNRRANQVAHFLAQAYDIRPDTPIGLLVDRSLEMVVGLLTILKAGAAVVPLDPAAPGRRGAFMAADTQMPVLLTTSQHLGLASEIGCTAVALDDLAQFGQLVATDLAVDLPASALAYILYTSGSTGQPKGVMVEHRQLSHYVHAVVKLYGFEQPGQFAMVQPLTVDSCQTMIFPALGWGGTLHLITRENALDAVWLADYSTRQAIDHLKIAPSHLSALMAAHPVPALLPRRTLVVGGEALPWSLVDRIHQLAPTCDLWNHYGPTETTVAVLTCPVSFAADDVHQRRASTAPIGWPLANVAIDVRDQYGNSTPVGVPGELVVGGALVARGYIGRPGQTAQQFIPDRSGPTAGGRLYQTGDQVRQHPDGAVEFLGRADDQVKIRGFRVEPGEIAAALGGCPGVADRAVAVRKDDTDQPYLVAYCTPTRGRELDVRSIHEFLRQRLPGHMVPEAIVILDSLPRTLHGKVDRQALPPPGDLNRVHIQPSHQPPRNELEASVAAIWAEVLRLPRIGVSDSFFEVGGHSLLATQVVSRIRRTLQVELSLRTIFEQPTVAGLAAHLAALYPALAAADALLPAETEEFLL